MRFPKRAYWYAMAAIVVVGLAARLMNIAAEPYWGDEVLSLDITRSFSTAREIAQYIWLVEFHPPLYYLMLKPWIGWFGISEAATRSLSVVFSVATIVAVGEFARRLWSSRAAALAAALLCALMPLQIEYGQEARPYAIYGFFAVLACLALWEQRERTRWGWLVTYVAASALGLYLHYSYVLVMVATALWFGVLAVTAPRETRGRAVITFLAAHAAILLLVYPTFVAFLYKLVLGDMVIFGMPHIPYVTRRPDHVAYAVTQVIWLTKYQSVANWELVLQGVGVIAACAAGLAAGLRAPVSREVPPPRSWRTDPLLYIGWLLVSVTVLYAASPQSQPYTLIPTRHIVELAALLAVLLGGIAARLTPRYAVAALAIFTVSLIPCDLRVMDNDAKFDGLHRVNVLGGMISAMARPGDITVTNMAFSRSDIAFYLPDDMPVTSIIPHTYYDIDIGNTRHTLGLIENESQVRDRASSELDVEEKFRRIIQKYQPKRMWVVDFAATDGVRRWLTEHGWRQVLSAGNLTVPAFLFERVPDQS